MFTLTEEIKKQIEDSYNFYFDLYVKKENTSDKNFYLGKCLGMEEVLSCLGYKTKMKYGIVTKEEE